jgi:hypothetical protein
MVYDRTVAGRPWDCPGARAIREAAHCEDFVSARTPLGERMTELVKGGACKVELAQMLVESIPRDDALDRLRDRAWQPLSDERREYVEGIKPTLLENAYVMTFRRGDAGPSELGGDALGPGSDTPRPSRRATGNDEITRVLIALAVRPEPGRPRISTGEAVDYYTQTVPDADYLFYCYGSSLLVARRLNQADYSLNLGALMPHLGGPHDGGHAGAAVCRPDLNPAYPHRLLGSVRPRSFRSFARYVQSRLADAGHEPLRLENRSTSSKTQLRRGGGKLVLVALLAALIGLLLVALRTDFRPARVRQSNREFFPHLSGGQVEGEDS